MLSWLHLANQWRRLDMPRDRGGQQPNDHEASIYGREYQDASGDRRRPSEWPAGIMTFMTFNGRQAFQSGGDRGSCRHANR